MVLAVQRPGWATEQWPKLVNKGDEVSLALETRRVGRKERRTLLAQRA